MGTVDMLKPDEPVLAEKASVIDAWRSALETGLPLAAGAAGWKSSGDGGLGLPISDGVAAGPPAKRQRTTAVSMQDVTLDSMRTMMATGEVERLTAVQLKEFLQ